MTIIDGCSRAGLESSEGRMRPAGREFDIPDLQCLQLQLAIITSTKIKTFWLNDGKYVLNNICTKVCESKIYSSLGIDKYLLFLLLYLKRNFW